MISFPNVNDVIMVLAIIGLYILGCAVIFVSVFLFVRSFTNDIVSQVRSGKITRDEARELLNELEKLGGGGAP